VVAEKEERKREGDAELEALGRATEASFHPGTATPFEPPKVDKQASIQKANILTGNNKARERRVVCNKLQGISYDRVLIMFATK
jgi:hypothetical protein